VQKVWSIGKNSTTANQTAAVLAKIDTSRIYHVTYCDGARSRKYVRRDQVPEMLAACQEHRHLQAQLRAGRAEYKQALAQTRRLAKLLGDE
jgi:hypothetical protein